MLAIRIDDDVLARYPEARINLVRASDLNNSDKWADVESRLSSLESELSNGTWQPYTEVDPQISSWHDAFRQFGTNPRRSRPSLDALSRRLAKTGALPRISSAVDAYNYVSVAFGVPAGAFDLDRIEGEIAIRFAKSLEMFTPLGQPGEPEPVKEGEVIYADSERVLTRHWNHRDANETKVTADSREVLFILERISTEAVSNERLDEAQEVLVDLLAPHSKGLSKATLSRDCTSTLLARARPPEITG